VRPAILAALLFGLAACDGAVPAGQEPYGPIRTDNSSTDQGGAADKASSSETGSVPEAAFIGTWAASEQGCEASPWTLSDTGLQTPAGSACSFNRVTEVPGGWDIQATCTAEAPPSSDEIRIRLGDDGRTMRFESKTIASARLELCDRGV